VSEHEALKELWVKLVIMVPNYGVKLVIMVPNYGWNW